MNVSEAFRSDFTYESLSNVLPLRWEKSYKIYTGSKPKCQRLQNHQRQSRMGQAAPTHPERYGRDGSICLLEYEVEHKADGWSSASRSPCRLGLNKDGGIGSHAICCSAGCGRRRAT